MNIEDVVRIFGEIPVAKKNKKENKKIKTKEANSFWQICPKCSGQGIVSKPSYIAGDVSSWVSQDTHYKCNLCDGKMIISTTTGLPPIFSKED